MMRRQTCDRCGAKFDVSGLQAGDAFTCGACGQVLEVSEPAPPSRAPRRAGKRGTPRPVADPVAKARVKAAKLCSTSLYTGIAAGVFLLLPFFGVIPAMFAAATGVVVGILGLMGLARVGLGDASPEASPLERVGAKMARRARPQAFGGLALGVVMLGLPIVLMLAGKAAQEQREEQSRQAWDKWAEDAQAVAAELAKDAPKIVLRWEEDARADSLFRTYVDSRLSREGAAGAHADTLKEAAEWTCVVVTCCPNSELARKLHDPQADLSENRGLARRLLHDMAPKPADERRLALETLTAALRTENESRWELADLLTGIEPPAVEAISSLQALADEGGDAGAAARDALARLRAKEPGGP